MPLLSIIIPVYNARRYLNTCIDSILKQDFTDYELLLVNDGSSDGSEKLCDTYASDDPRIRVIHQKNQGVSAARNTGLFHSRGTYICFVDADDWIDPDLLKICMEKITSCNADILQHGMLRTIYKNDQLVSTAERFVFPSSQCVTRTEFATILQSDFKSISATVFNYVFKKDLLLNLSFDTDMPYAEDTLFAMQALSKANTYYLLKNHGYHYSVRAGSAAYKWQPKMTECYTKSLNALSFLLQTLNVPEHTKTSVLAIHYINAYSSLIYNLCLPTCQLTLKEKFVTARTARNLFQVDKYKRYYQVKELNLFSKVKIHLTFFHLENLLLLLGPLYLKNFTND